jgi:hypothetical protein
MDPGPSSSRSVVIDCWSQTKGQVAYELLAWVSAPAGPPGDASGSFDGGLDQAEGHPEADSQGAVRASSSRDCHHGGGAIHTTCGHWGDGPPPAPWPRLSPWGLLGESSDPRSRGKVPADLLKGARPSGGPTNEPLSQLRRSHGAHRHLKFHVVRRVDGTDSRLPVGSQLDVVAPGRDQDFKTYASDDFP